MRALGIAVGLLTLVSTAAVPTFRVAAEDLSGTWIAVHGIEGDVIGNIEELRIAKDGQVTVYIHYYKEDPPCDGSRARASAACRRPALYASGTLVVDGGKRELTLTGTVAPELAMPDPDGRAGPKYWLSPGARYAYNRAGKMLRLHNTSAPVERNVPHPRLTRWPEATYFESDDEHAVDLMDYAVGSAVPIVSLACLLPVVHADEGAIQPIRDLVREAARIERHMADLRARAMATPSGDPSGVIREALLTFGGLEPGVPRHQPEIERFAATIGVSVRSLEIMLKAGKGPPTRRPALPADFRGREELSACIDAVFR